MSKIPQRRRVGALDATGHALVIKAPVPKPKTGQVLVRVRASLVSPGTELSGAKRARAEGQTDPGTPRPFGYQNAGDVIALGRGVKQFKVGDRVACMGGGYALHADYSAVPQNLCAVLPPELDYEHGAYGHLAMTALHAIRRARIQLGDYVLIVGLGIVGQVAGQLAKLSGAYVMGWDLTAGRRRIARRCGFDSTTGPGEDDLTGGAGFDHAVIAFGGQGDEAQQAVTQVMKLTPDGHREGNIVLVGGVTTTCNWAAGLGNLNFLSSARTGPGYHDEPWEHGGCAYPPVWMRWTTRTNMDLVMRLMAEKRLRIDPLTTHRLGLAKIDDAVTAHIERPSKTLGTVLLMD
jgi:threonine dehydrogenase-like Zn-dependent dehydrogenase